MLKTRFLPSLILLLTPFLCWGHNLHDCNKEQSAQIWGAVADAKYYLWLVANESNPALFIKWMGYNDIADIKWTFYKIDDVLRDGKIDFYCGKGDFYALSSPQDDYLITLGDKFWKAPDNGLNSKPGTLIHELTHFNSIGKTVDSFLAHYPDEALQQAKIDTGQAVVLHNANNYEYLAEDIWLNDRHTSVVVQAHHAPAHEDHHP